MGPFESKRPTVNPKNPNYDQDKKFWKEVEKWNSPTREILFRDKNKHISHDAHALWDPWRNQALCAQASPQWYNRS